MQFVPHNLMDEHILQDGEALSGES